MALYLKRSLESLPPRLQLSSYFRTNQVPRAQRSPNGLQSRTISIYAKHPKAILTLAVLVFLFLWKDIIYNFFSLVTSRSETVSLVDTNPVRNDTLGFQEIFVLALPDRGDRKAPLLAAAHATNISVTVLDAVRDRQIPESEYPESWQIDGWVAKEGELGCLMSHVRTWRKIIHENITSALITESDVDWDVRIKDSMEGFGRGAKTIADWPFDEPQQHPRAFSKESTLSPYGDKWDLLWIGHCGSSANGNGRIYAFNDSSAPSESHAWSFAERPSPGHRPNNTTRIVFQIKKAICTTSYAISNRGAHKLERLFRTVNYPIDLKLWEYCENDPSLSCIGVWPQIISMAESRTNIMHNEGGQALGRETTEENIVAGKGIQISARVNAHLGTVDKGPTMWRAEWKTEEEEAPADDTVLELEERT